MSSDKILVSDFIPAPAEAIFDAWIDAETHGHMTGGAATSEPRVGGRFTAWDEYIEGAHRELERPRLIVQSWRSTEFPEDAPDSLLVVRLEPEGDGTRVFLDHRDIPEGQGQSYEQGWKEHYLEPMKRFFARWAPSASAAPAEHTEPKPARKAAPKQAAPAKRPAPKKVAAKRAAPKKAAPKKAAAKRKAAPKKAAPKRTARKPAKKAARKPARKVAAKRPAAKKKAGRSRR